jgi:hypothetical protein
MDPLQVGISYICEEEKGNREGGRKGRGLVQLFSNQLKVYDYYFEEKKPLKVNDANQEK